MSCCSYEDYLDLPVAAPPARVAGTLKSSQGGQEVVDGIALVNGIGVDVPALQRRLVCNSAIQPILNQASEL